VIDLEHVSVASTTPKEKKGKAIISQEEAEKIITDSAKREANNKAT
jgi:hypothetical protein